MADGPSRFISTVCLGAADNERAAAHASGIPTTVIAVICFICRFFRRVRKDPPYIMRAGAAL